MDQLQSTEPNPSSSLFQMNLAAQNSYNLRSATSWAKVLGVVGIIFGIILIILMGILLNVQENSYDYRYRGGVNGFFRQIGFWVFILAGIIFIIGGIFSLNFGNKIGQALKSNDQDGLNTGFAALRNYFALRAITIIVVLLFVLIGIMSNV